MAHAQALHDFELEEKGSSLSQAESMENNPLEVETVGEAVKPTNVECQSKKKSHREEQNKRKSGISSPSTEKGYTLVIVPPKSLNVSQGIMTKYLKECLGNEFKFFLKDTKVVEGRTCQFTFAFQSGNQAKKAEQLLKENIRASGENVEVTVVKEDPKATTEIIISKCKKELQEKIQLVKEKHAAKLKEVETRLNVLRVRKHISLEEFEKIQSEREAIKQKRDELQQQQEEFEQFCSQMFENLSAHTGKPCSSVEKTIKKLRMSLGRECHRLDEALPMYARKSSIVETIKKSQVSVVLGETGSGKSTQMTQYLYEAGFAENGLIVCTQPRKVAATSLASRVAQEMGGALGQIVGCHVGGNIQASKSTGIVYATDHILLNECLRDPSLSKYSCIIVDEAHERSIYTDLLLGMIKKSLALRPELRVVITSATINPTLFVTYFNQCPVLKVSGRMFPVDVIWRDGTSSSGNYLQEAVEKVREIHRGEGQGDILVFLTSPAETERACDYLKKMEPVNENLVCLPLHGKLRQEEQRRVFNEETNKRKVIFATNCAETSITIPGIKYVVDTGLVKEMKFEPKRNKSSLEVTTTNKSSAEQRRGRAGRTQAGKCYRLYSEEDYETMEDGSRPEILRVHLGQAVLKLMELGIEDITKFDFVESPPLESIELALELLKSLGAIANGKLTELGHRIAKVPVEPRLAKLVFNGIDQGISADAVALAAIATVSGSVFFRMGTEEEKQLADQRKVVFCHNGGDLLTVLEVYRQYLQQPKGRRNKWAFDKSLNAKSLRLTEDTVKELNLALKNELNIEVSSAVQQNEDTDLKLQRILFSCYANNLCVFTGHEKAGYKVVSLNHCVQLHPSSALKFLGTTPKFMVFEQLLKTSRDFVINATPVEESWLQEMIMTGAVNYNMDDLMSAVLTQVTLPCSPDLMTLAFRGFQGRKMLDRVQEKVSKACDDSLVVLEKDEKSGQVKAYVPLNYTSTALSVVEDHLEETRRSLRSEDREEKLKGSSGTRIVWGKGGEVQEVLMSHMFRTVTVGDVEDGKMVLDYLRSFGDVVRHRFIEKNGKTRVFATFKISDKAAKAVESSADIKPSDATPDGVHVQLSHFAVRATWVRRPGKGTGNIEFFNAEDYSHTRSSIHSLMIKSRRVVFQVDRFCPEERLFMRGLDPETTEEDVMSAIEVMVPSVKVKKVILHRKPGFETTDETLESQRKFLAERVGDFTTPQKLSISMVKPRPNNFLGCAHIKFQDFNEGEAAVRGLNGKGIPGIGNVTLQPNLSTKLPCPRNVFSIIEEELQTVIKELQERFGKAITVKVKNQDISKRVLLEIHSDSTEHFLLATKVLNESLNGDTIDCKISNSLETLLTNPVKEVLRSIEKDTGAAIYQDWKNKVLKIHGSQASRESAKRAINDFLNDSMVNDSHPWQIHLRGPSKPRGLLKALFNRFGVNLLGLQEIPGVQRIHVEFHNHVLQVVSSHEAQETINRCVEECCQSILSDSPQTLQCDYPEPQISCCICLCDLDETAEVYRLACCGHAFDKTCVIQQIKSGDVPLKCVAESCGEPLVWRDLQNLLTQSERKSLACSALDMYVRRNPDTVKYCPTADCEMVYRVSSDGRCYKCEACLAETCTSCHTQYHNGLTCTMFKSEKKVEGSLKEWMMKVPDNRKCCPKCNTPIEKNEGCNHMTCSQCKSHMCWLCLEVFPSGEQVYDHQRHCPKRTLLSGLGL